MRGKILSPSERFNPFYRKNLMQPQPNSYPKDGRFFTKRASQVGRVTPCAPSSHRNQPAQPQDKFSNDDPHKTATKFPLLPKGEGRDEGEEPITKRTLQSFLPQKFNAATTKFVRQQRKAFHKNEPPR